MALNFIQTRSGLDQHFTDRRLSDRAGYLYLRLLMKVGVEGFPELGVVWTSVPDIARRICQSWSESNARDAYRALVKGEYIVPHRQKASRGTYPIQIHRWTVPLGPTQGMKINALATTDYKNPVFFEPTQPNTHTPRREPQTATPDSNPTQVPQTGTPHRNRERDKEREGGRSPSPSAAPKPGAPPGDKQVITRSRGGESAAGTQLGHSSATVGPQLPAVSAEDVAQWWREGSTVSVGAADVLGAGAIVEQCQDPPTIRRAMRKFWADPNCRTLPLRTLAKQFPEWREKAGTGYDRQAAIDDAEKHRAAIEEAQANAVPPPKNLMAMITGEQEATA